MEPLRNDSRVASVRTAYEGGVVDAGSISRDGHSTTVKIELKDYTASQMVQAMDIYPQLRAEVNSDKLEVTAFGTLPNNYEVTVIGERDAKRTEIGLFPLVGLLLLLVFGSLLGAALPLAVGLLAVTAGIAGTLALARITPVLVFAQNVVVMVGLGVAIDYSLFILSQVSRGNSAAPCPGCVGTHLATTGQSDSFLGRYGSYRFIWHDVHGAGQSEFYGPCGRYCGDTRRSLLPDISPGAPCRFGAQGRFLEPSVY